MVTRTLIATALFALAVPMQAYAQQQTIVMQGGKIISGGGAASAQAGEEQQLMNDAPNYVLRRDYQGAEGLYTHVIGINKNNIGAYIQRGLVRRELGNQQGAMADGQIAVTLTNELMNTLPNNANLYYQRAMGFRLMRQFPQAREDMQKAINLSGGQTWDNDLKAIILEQKMAVGR